MKRILHDMGDNEVQSLRNFVCKWPATPIGRLRPRSEIRADFEKLSDNPVAR